MDNSPGLAAGCGQLFITRRDDYLRAGGHAVVVDPGEAVPVLTALRASGLRLVGILLTHHHADHVGGVAGLVHALGPVPVYGPADDRVTEATTRVRDGDRVVLDGLCDGGLEFEVLEVPGHTTSHVAFHGHGLLFSGDTLFSVGCGRMFEGTPSQMSASLDRPQPMWADGDEAAVARWSALLDNNVGSMMRLTRALLPLMPEGASVINQSSMWGLIGIADFSAYVASKHAVIGLTRSLAWELAPRGIRVNAVCPGWIRTAAAMRSLTSMAQTQGRSEADVEREILSRQANPTMLDAADIAGVFLFLASRDARSLTGQAISASHGEVMN
jgi:NAD(P)-dependent dehydrogenase (short-subunit alcohol dehydrogenase family)